MLLITGASEASAGSHGGGAPWARRGWGPGEQLRNADERSKQPRTRNYLSAPHTATATTQPTTASAA